ncbi:MAG TPA: hypothetical protein DFS52_13200 [Myxococcales bacterium]|jgi:hypothetical protein|nr:hypothetical protein [Myxococcales bacterium]
MRISDSRLRGIYNDLLKKSATLDDSAVPQILAAVGDSSRLSFKNLLAQLSAPGLTKQQQLDLCLGGMTNNEKGDICQILDEGEVPMSPTARNFLEALVGRSALQGNDPLQIIVTGDQKNGIAGIAGPNVTIEAINLSTAPGSRLHVDDTMVIGRTDEFGRFMGSMDDVQEGDIIRMRARGADGKVGEWVTMRAGGISAQDTRHAVVALSRVGLADAGAGKLKLEAVESRPLTEPGARLQLTNERTGEKTVVTADENGKLAGAVMLNGKPGDVFSVAATDGQTNTDFAVETGKLIAPGGASDNLVVDLPDPAMCKDELDANGNPKFELKRFSGPLFHNGIAPGDVEQGYIGDCYFPAAMAALAQAQPEVIENMIRANGDGSYTVTFKERDWRSGGYKDVEIQLDGDLWARSWGSPIYGASGGDKSQKKMELWWPLIEKAYAMWQGSYEAIGNGGLSSDIWEACMGRDGAHSSVKYMKPDSLWAEIKDAVDNKLPCGAGTYGESQEALYTNSGIYANHAYSILGYEERDGERFVTMRNPWGQSEPAGNGRDDGIFKVTLADFQKYYQSFMTVRD